MPCRDRRRYASAAARDVPPTKSLPYLPAVKRSFQLAESIDVVSSCLVIAVAAVDEVNNPAVRLHRQIVDSDRCAEFRNDFPDMPKQRIKRPGAAAQQSPRFQPL